MQSKGLELLNKLENAKENHCYCVFADSMRHGFKEALNKSRKVLVETREDLESYILELENEN